MTVLAILRDLLCSMHQSPQSQHWILLAQSGDQQITRVDHSTCNDSHRAFWTDPFLRLPVSMPASPSILDPRSPRWNLLEHNRTCWPCLRHLWTQCHRRLDLWITSILDRQRSADPRPAKAPRRRTAGFRSGRIYCHCCAAAIRSHIETQR